MDNIEIWKDIPGYEGLYQASNLGRIKSVDRYVKWNNRYHKEYKQLKKGKILKPAIDNYGCLIVGLSKNNKLKSKRVHQLVVETFKPDRNNFKIMDDEIRENINLKKLHINHIDENKLNNNIDNLEWCTHKYNQNWRCI